MHEAFLRHYSFKGKGPPGSLRLVEGSCRHITDFEDIMFYFFVEQEQTSPQSCG